ncbi:uncharacterized protein [Chelonus insularis]|uniref:uncharacterized protein isoform X2 n=1 Tax=Chelonus insularis TaxID=460826 RepID=UPI00158BF886|nr:uncharacterized protein LOC118066093 isoform X2 [Chelonus insularis]
MEDSYTVHRRRKAAARRRDKTPEASRAVGGTKDVNNAGDDDDDDRKKLEARARMEQMVEDTEKMEELATDGRKKSSPIVEKPDTKVETNDDKKKDNQVVSSNNDKSELKSQQKAESTDENFTVKDTMNENRLEASKRVKSTVFKEEAPRRRPKRSKERKHSSDSSLAEDDRSSKSDKDERKRKPRRLRREIRNEEPQVISANLTLPIKQIIPLSSESLIEDFKKAQIEYERRELGILEVEIDDYVHPKMEAALRRRSNKTIEKDESEVVEDKKTDQTTNEHPSWLWSWLSSFKSKVKDEKLEDEEKKKKEEAVKQEEIRKEQEKKEKESEETKKVVKKSKLLEFIRLLSDLKEEFKAFVAQNPHEIEIICKIRNKCIIQLILIIIYCGLGAFVFRFIEGAFETFYKCGVKRVKRDFLDSLWNYSHNLREDDWKSMARRKLMEFEEQLHAAHEAGVHSYSGQKSWTFLNAVVYCLTVITTIGYGHISPSTTTGRAVTIVYAIFGIPMFLIILADFGKLFTRGIKFLWAFVRRVYYTGSCKRVRRTAPVQEVMKGVQLVYDFATFRRPSQMNPEELAEMRKQQTVLNLDGNAPVTQPGTPATPELSAFAIDDEFNLPISVAITILLVYIFVGATVYNIWERWGFFESFYFVFISMSTIGFGDYVPKHPIYMMCSIVYLVFGLALTSMCINVVQVMLSDSFKHATQKIGATIGFEVTEDDGSIQPTVPPPVEVAEVHATIKEEDETKEAPKAKEEDVEL